MSSKKQVKRVEDYMRREAAEHVDPLTDECNATTLAEDAAQHFNLYVDGDEIPEWVFELAYEVSESDD